jgi:hypothetical protein
VGCVARRLTAATATTVTERGPWRLLAGEKAQPIYDPQADPRGPDGGFEHADLLRERIDGTTGV